MQEAFRTHHPEQVFGLQRFLSSADSSLSPQPLSVVTKTLLPPSGDKHDYLSLSRYYWPDPAKPNGLPWIKRDGQTNLERVKLAPDSEALGKTSYRIRALAMAYAITSDEKYLKKLLEVLRVWFFDASTKMNPNLNFSQGVPGKNSGAPSGIIEGNDFALIADSLFLINSSANLEFQQWLKQYRDWLLTSELGKAEGKARNNHRSWYNAQLASIDFFLGEKNSIAALAEKIKTEVLPAHIRADGGQPEELARTRPLQYSFFNLDALTRVAVLAGASGVALWPELKKAIDYLVPCVSQGGVCPFKAEIFEGSSASPNEVDPFRIEYAVRVLRRAYGALPEHPYAQLILELESKIPNQKIEVQTLCLPRPDSSILIKKN